MTDKETADSLDRLINIFSGIKETDWQIKNLQEVADLEVKKDIASGKGDRGRLLWPFRVALTGKQASAGPFEIADILEKEETIRRLNNAKNLLN
jgi:hypothetical protein